MQSVDKTIFQNFSPLYSYITPVDMMHYLFYLIIYLKIAIIFPPRH